MYYGLVYLVENKINGKKYIGQTTKNLHQRRIRHIYEAKANLTTMPFHEALIKYGEENFVWAVLEKCYTKCEMDEMEFHYIQQYNTYGKDGYNATMGGDGAVGVRFTEDRRKKARLSIYNSPIYGKKGKDHPFYGQRHSAESRKKISEALSGDKHPFYGKPCSSERKANISESLKGRKLSETNKLKISETRKR